MAFLVLQFWAEDRDLGWVGLMFLLTMIFFLIGFSFLVAAATPGYDIKIAVVVVDGLVLIGSRLLAPHFLQYLAEQEITANGFSKANTKVASDLTENP
jgi:hypothetical protein